MQNFDKQAFMKSLRAALPKARVCEGGFNALSSEQKIIARENLHAINSQYNHGPVLGGGSLYNTRNNQRRP